MTPVLLHRGHRRAAWAEKGNGKAPSVAGGAQKNPCTRYSAHAKPLVHPLKVDSRMREAHIIVAVRLKPRMTILLKRKRTARGRVACFMAQPLARPRGAHLAKSTGGDHPLNTTRPNEPCLCAISQLNYELRSSTVISERREPRQLRRDGDRSGRSSRRTCARPCESPASGGRTAGVRGFAIGCN